MQNSRSRRAVTLALWTVAVLAGYFGYQHLLNSQFARAEERRQEVQAGLRGAEDLASAFRDVGKVVEPTVVKIDVRKKLGARGAHPFDEDMLRRFFPDRDGDGEPDLPRGFQMPDEDSMPEQIGTGSGVIMEVSSNKGYILTNNHVAGGAEEMEITLYDGRTIKNARLVGADAKTDLAVVEIPGERLATAKWGNSDQLQKGDWIMAFGSPFGYVGSMTHGIVSALHRTDIGILGTGGYENFIQVDAPINPGNSGGPVVNLRGEVVGISTAIASRSGGFQGVGFAIPSNQAKVVYTQLKEKGKVVRGWLGVSIKDVSKYPELAGSFGYKGQTGVLVDEVLEGTPAAGILKPGDIIVSANSKPVEDVQQLRNAIAALPPGTEVRIQVFRDSKQQEVALKLGEQPENLLATRQRGGEGGGRQDRAEQGATNLSELGLRVQTITPELAERHGLDANTGALILRVDPNSPAGREGLRAGDVITQAGNKQVRSADDLSAALKGADLNKGIRLYVTSRDGSRFVFITREKSR